MDGTHSSTRHVSSLPQHAPTKYTMFGCRSVADRRISARNAHRVCGVMFSMFLTATRAPRHVASKTSPADPEPTRRTRVTSPGYSNTWRTAGWRLMCERHSNFPSRPAPPSLSFFLSFLFAFYLAQHLLGPCALLGLKLHDRRRPKLDPAAVAASVTAVATAVDALALHHLVQHFGLRVRHALQVPTGTTHHTNPSHHASHHTATPHHHWHELTLSGENRDAVKRTRESIIAGHSSVKQKVAPLAPAPVWQLS